MKEYFSFIYKNKKLFFLIIVLISSIFISLVILALKGRRDTSPIPPIITFQRSPSPTPSNLYTHQINYQQLLTEDVKDLHWLNDKELAYSWFDQNIKHRALAKIDTSTTTRTALIQDSNIKMSEVFWSFDNKLLIFDYGTPYTTYLYDASTDELKKITLNGYGYSWAPNGESIFFYDLNSNPASSAIYNIKTNSSSLININTPAFIASYWSTLHKMLLYNFNLETGSGTISILDLTSRSIDQPTTNNLVFPSWSPSGSKFAYISDGGIYTSTGRDIVQIYSTSTQPHFISYSFLDDENILVFDGGKTANQFTLISLNSNSKKAVLQDFKIQGNQRAQFATSLNSNSLAIALEKDGLWVVKKEFILK